jgi:hypothetical protein
MELILNTTKPDSIATEGELLVDGAFSCYTLELPIKDGLPGSAIPAGRFPVVAQPSPDFENSADPWIRQYAAKMPHIICPPRSLIMIHWGNRVTDVRGCVAVGQTQGVDFIGSSRLAFAPLYQIIFPPMMAGNLWITVNR